VPSVSYTTRAAEPPPPKRRRERIATPADHIARDVSSRVHAGVVHQLMPPRGCCLSAWWLKLCPGVVAFLCRPLASQAPATAASPHCCGGSAEPPLKCGGLPCVSWYVALHASTHGRCRSEACRACCACASAKCCASTQCILLCRVGQQSYLYSFVHASQGQPSPAAQRNGLSVQRFKVSVQSLNLHDVLGASTLFGLLPDSWARLLS